MRVVDAQSSQAGPGAGEFSFASLCPYCNHYNETSGVLDDPSEPIDGLYTIECGKCGREYKVNLEYTGISE